MNIVTINRMGMAGMAHSGAARAGVKVSVVYKLIRLLYIVYFSNVHINDTFFVSLRSLQWGCLANCKCDFPKRAFSLFISAIFIFKKPNQEFIPIAWRRVDGVWNSY